MTPTESLTLGLNGFALAWESVLVVLGALLVGLALGLVARARSSRRGPGASTGAAEREREVESLRPRDELRMEHV